MRVSREMGRCAPCCVFDVRTLDLYWCRWRGPEVDENEHAATCCCGIGKEMGLPGFKTRISQGCIVLKTCHPVVKSRQVDGLVIVRNLTQASGSLRNGRR